MFYYAIGGFSISGKLDVNMLRGTVQCMSGEQLQYVLTTLRQEERTNTSPTRPEEEAADYKCQHCEKSYTSMTSLKKHLAISHKIKFQGGIKFDAAKHATGNLPQCANLQDWKSWGHARTKWQSRWHLPTRTQE